ncbi:hypothetical protein ACFFTM_01775 [Pseudoduganella plicata]|nr:hypothetical protein [Pseudoduganella plicata]QBQ36740.1 hypothetical protein E1742_11610 [Pseudoduganella plicata]
MNESTIKTAALGVEHATAAALAAILDDEIMPATAALQELTQRNNELLTRGDDAIRESLGRQAVVLEALFYRLLQSAAAAKRNDVTAVALRSAINTQKSLLTTLGALKQMRSEDA